MKKCILFLVVLTSLNAFSQFTLKDLKALYSLSGRWESSRRQGMLTEEWSIIDDSSMHAYSYITNEKDTVPEEKVSLVLRKGKILYIADAAGQNAGNPVAFTLSAIDNGRYVFENKAHDFPRQISYQLINNSTLHAAIDGPLNGKDVHVDFHFKRIK